MKERPPSRGSAIPIDIFVTHHSSLAEHLLSHLEEAKGAPQSNQNDAIPEKAVEVPPADQPTTCESANTSADVKRKSRRGRRLKVSTAEIPLVVVDDKDSSGES